MLACSLSCRCIYFCNPADSSSISSSIAPVWSRIQYFVTFPSTTMDVTRCSACACVCVCEQLCKPSYFVALCVLSVLSCEWDSSSKSLFLSA